MELLGLQAAPLWPLAIYFFAATALAAGAIALSHVLGQRRHRASESAYESGMIPTGTARLRFSADFYLIAMFFVIFDLETVFLVAWAVAARELGWAGYLGAATFIGVLAAALAYLWRSGALEWGPAGKKRRQAALMERDIHDREAAR